MIDAGSFRGGDFGHDRVAAPILRRKFAVLQLLLDAIDGQAVGHRQRLGVVTDAEVLITAERGEMQLSPSEAWLNDAERIDAPTMAARLYPLTSRRLHVFAAAHTDGWHCLVGNDSWVEEPSIR